MQLVCPTQSERNRVVMPLNVIYGSGNGALFDAAGFAFADLTFPVARLEVDDMLGEDSRLAVVDDVAEGVF